MKINKRIIAEAVRRVRQVIKEQEEAPVEAGAEGARKTEAPKEGGEARTRARCPFGEVCQRVDMKHKDMYSHPEDPEYHWEVGEHPEEKSRPSAEKKEERASTERPEQEAEAEEDQEMRRQRPKRRKGNLL